MPGLDTAQKITNTPIICRRPMSEAEAADIIKTHYNYLLPSVAGICLRWLPEMKDGKIEKIITYKDAIQEVFLRAIKALQVSKGEINDLKFWINKIAWNFCKTVVKTKNDESILDKDGEEREDEYFKIINRKNLVIVKINGKFKFKDKKQLLEEIWEYFQTHESEETQRFLEKRFKENKTNLQIEVEENKTDSWISRKINNALDKVKTHIGRQENG